MTTKAELRSRFRWFLPGILATAVVLRLGVAVAMGNEVNSLPGIHDQISYHTLAVRLLTGHGLSFPDYWWPATLPDAPTAFWSYVYTGYLWAVYSIFGVSPLAARLIQALIVGLGMPWFTYRIGRQAFGELTGLIGAAWAAVYGYFVYYGAALMTESFHMLGILWTLDVALRLADREGVFSLGTGEMQPWAELGLAIALTSLLRQVFLFFVPVLFAWLAWALLRRPQKMSAAAFGRGAVICVAVVAVLIAPITLYNYRLFGRPVLINTNAGFGFFWANHPVYGDRFLPLLEPQLPGATVPTYQELIPPELLSLNEAALDSELMRRGLGFVAADPARYVRLSLSRVPVYFNFWPSSHSSTLSNIVRVGSFGVALPFILVGIALWLFDFRRLGGLAGPGGLLWLFALVYSGTYLLSWALIRYRLPVDAVMLAFAAYGVSRIAYRVSHAAPLGLQLAIRARR
jgi:4-amino-4-deoxy-L-arabinose transferase-like glycosyltransferase